MQQAMRRVLDGFEEGDLDFPPTYRWKKDDNSISNKRAQAPSYTDRILHRSLPGVAWCVELDRYSSASRLFGSDHRAVYANYSL